MCEYVCTYMCVCVCVYLSLCTVVYVFTCVCVHLSIYVGQQLVAGVFFSNSMP